MTILALEFSSERRSVALARDGVVLAEAFEQTSGRVTHAFELIEKVLAETEITKDEITTLAIGLGPGSYTGIRAAIATAQGWQLATNIKLLGISSAEAIAAGAQAQNILGRVHVLIDAQRGEFYQAIWDISNDALVELDKLKIISGEAVAAASMAGTTCVGPQMKAPLFPAARMIACLAMNRSDYLTGEALEPIYLRETSFVKAGPIRII